MRSPRAGRCFGKSRLPAGRFDARLPVSAGQSEAGCPRWRPRGRRSSAHRRFRSAPQVLARRRKRDRAAIVAAGELDQRRHPAFHRRMGIEQFAEAFARVVDAHFHDGRGGARQFAAALDLAQRRDHRVRILGELDRAGIGEEFARTRQSKPNKERQHVGQHQNPMATTIATAAPPPRRSSERELRKLKPL